jgi:replicative DNA helicase
MKRFSLADEFVDAELERQMLAAVRDGGAEILKEVADKVARSPEKRCLLIVDYLQRLAQARGFEGLRQNVSAVAEDLRDLATRLDSPVLVLSSLSRPGYEGGKAAGIENLKESGDLEFSADSVVLLESDNKTLVAPPKRALRLRVLKNRFGPAGQEISLVFRPDICTILELEE